MDDDDGLGFGAADNTNNFAVNKARLTVGGSVFNENITYFVQTDFANGGDDLVDAWAGWRMNEGINIRLGQQKMRSSLQADASLTDNVGELVTSALATQGFAGQRATGVLVEGNSGNMNWHVGAMNNSTSGTDVVILGQGQNNAPGENELNYTAGVSFGSGPGNSEDWSEGDLAQGGNSSWIAGASLLLSNEGDGEGETVNAFGGWKSGSGIAVQAEWFVRENDDNGFGAGSNGFYGQFSYTMPASDGVQYGAVARYSVIDLDDNGESSEVSVGVNAYYHEHALKTQLQVTFTDTDIVLLPFYNVAGDDLGSTSLDLLFTLMF
jgi:hypothetical protein